MTLNLLQISGAAIRRIKIKKYLYNTSATYAIVLYVHKDKAMRP